MQRSCASPGPGPESCRLGGRQAEAQGIWQATKSHIQVDAALRLSLDRRQKQLHTCDKVHFPGGSTLLENMSEKHKAWPHEGLDYNI